jgi:quinol monooxygenase YgiN
VRDAFDKLRADGPRAETRGGRRVKRRLGIIPRKGNRKSLQSIELRRALLLIAALILCAGCAPHPGRVVEEPHMPFIRVAELQIDPAQLQSYEAAVKEEIQTSVREEAGVLAIYAVAEKDDPAKLRFFEMYTDEAAYRAHIGSPHFRKYVDTTKDMITSRRLIDTVPIQLSAKKQQ